MGRNDDEDRDWFGLLFPWIAVGMGVAALVAGAMLSAVIGGSP